MNPAKETGKIAEVLRVRMEIFFKKVLCLYGKIYKIMKMTLFAKDVFYIIWTMIIMPYSIFILNFICFPDV